MLALDSRELVYGNFMEIYGNLWKFTPDTTSWKESMTSSSRVSRVYFELFRVWASRSGVVESLKNFWTVWKFWELTSTSREVWRVGKSSSELRRVTESHPELNEELSRVPQKVNSPLLAQTRTSNSPMCERSISLITGLCPEWFKKSLQFDWLTAVHLILLARRPISQIITIATVNKLSFNRSEEKPMLRGQFLTESLLNPISWVQKMTYIKFFACL